MMRKYVFMNETSKSLLIKTNFILQETYKVLHAFIASNIFFKQPLAIGNLLKYAFSSIHIFTDYI